MGKDAANFGWEVQGISNVGSEFIRGAKPQGLSFNTEFSFEAVAPVTYFQTYLTDVNNALTFPYPVMVEMAGMTGWVERNSGSGAIEVINSNDLVMQFLPGARNALQSFSIDSIRPYGTSQPGWSDSGMISLNGNDNYKDISSYGYIARALTIGFLWSGALDISDVITVQLTIRLKRV